MSRRLSQLVLVVTASAGMSLGCSQPRQRPPAHHGPHLRKVDSEQKPSRLRVTTAQLKQ